MASVTVGSVPPRPYEAGPGSAPALTGPTCSAPLGSNLAMEPPPAPISTMSTTGTFTGYPGKVRVWNSLYSVVTFGVLASTREHFAVVPPMSREITLGSPTSRPTAAAPITPATGPDSMSWIGRRLARAKVVVPRSEEHTSELQSPCNLVCRLLLEQKNSC